MRSEPATQNFHHKDTKTTKDTKKYHRHYALWLCVSSCSSCLRGETTCFFLALLVCKALTCTIICLKVEPFCKSLHKQPRPKLTRHFVSSPLALEGEPAVSRHTISHPTRTFHRPPAFALNVPGTSRQPGRSRPADHAARHGRTSHHADREQQRHAGR